MPRARLLFALLPVAPVAAAAVLFGMMACGSTSTADTVQPITGITVRAEALTTGRGCGTGATQIFKYAVVVHAPDPSDASDAGVPVGEYLAGNVYDCFTDGTFVELPEIGPSEKYSLEVFAYNQTAYAASGDTIAKLLARMNTNRSKLVIDAGVGSERAEIATDLAALRSTTPTYSTTCKASQLGLVQTLAVCDPLVSGSDPATVILPLATFPGADGGTFTCDDQYVTVRTTTQVDNGQASAPVDTRCSSLGDAGLAPATVTVANALAPASYTFTATLLRADGSTLGSTTCSAATSSGRTSTAVCKPVP